MTTLRLSCTAVCFDAMSPHIEPCDETGVGTGFLLSLPQEEGTVFVTAHHVVAGASSTVAASQTHELKQRHCRVLGKNPHLDVAFLHCDGTEGLPSFRCGRSALLSPETEVTIIGFAGGTLRTHTTNGRISGRRGFPHHRMQTDATVNGGNSGGPVVTGSGEDAEVVGIVTSGEDDLDHTNYFTPIDEVLLCLKRLKGKGMAPSSPPRVDFGFHFDALVAPVDEEACFGRRGGMLVLAAMPHTGLKASDVILACAGENGGEPSFALNSYGNALFPFLYEHDGLDFRSVLDTMRAEGGKEEVVWPLVVRREGEEKVVRVPCGSSRLPGRDRFPDCEGYPYFHFGGLILQTNRKSLPTWRRKREVASCFRPGVVCTHVLSGSPFVFHGVSPLVGEEVSSVSFGSGGKSTSYPSEDMETFHSAIARYTSSPKGWIRISFSSGAAVGASADALRAFHDSSALSQGSHEARRGPDATERALEESSSLPFRPKATFVYFPAFRRG